MRKRRIRLRAAAVLLLGFTGSAQAGQFDRSKSPLGLIIGGLPEVKVSALPGTESLVTLQAGSLLGPSTGHLIAVLSTVWSTINFGPGTSLFTGVPLISNLKLTVGNQLGILESSFTVASNSIGGGGVVGPGHGRDPSPERSNRRSRSRRRDLAAHSARSRGRCDG